MANDVPLETRKLQIELVPRPLWNRNVRKMVSTVEWNKIRKMVMAEQNNQCSICGLKNGEEVMGYDGVSHKTKLVCHEDWEYEDWDWEYEDQQWEFYPEHMQRLRGFVIVCSMCSYCIHFGNAQALAARGHIRLELVKAHYMAINQCSETDFAHDLQQATLLWEKRNQVDWIQEIDRSLFAWLFDSEGEQKKESPEEVQQREAWPVIRGQVREQGIKEVARYMRLPVDTLARIVGCTTPPDAGTVEWITHVLSGTYADEWYQRMVADRESFKPIE